MAIIRCPVCRTKFKWDLAALGYPEECPVKTCESHIGHDRADDDVVMPFVRSVAKAHVVDKVYRDMERGSEIRAQAAAEMTGATNEEMSGLKITDLRTGGRPGDVAAVPVPVNEVSKMIEANPGHFGHQAGNAFAGNVRTGPFPQRGSSFLQNFQNVNGGRGGRVV